MSATPRILRGHASTARVLSRKETTAARLRAHIGFNFFGAGNFGDDLMLAGFLSALGAQRERISLTCCTPYDIGSQRRRFPEIDWRPDTEAERDKAMAHADIWLGLGDTPFQTMSGCWMRDHLLSQLEMVRTHALPMFYVGVGSEGAGIFDDPGFRALAEGAEHIWCRDTASADHIRPHTQACVVAGSDLSHIFLGDPNLWPVWKDGPALGHADIGLLLAFEDPDRCFDQDAVRSLIATRSSVSWLVQEVRDFPGTERHLLQQLPDDVRERIQRAIPDYENAASVAELLAAWPRCDVAASSRYHALCTMAWRGTKLVALHRSGKIAGAADDLDIPCVDTRSLADGLKSARAVSEERLTHLADRASQMVDEFCRLVGISQRRRRASSRASIAVVKSDNIGDFVLLSPFMRALKGLWPDARITLYVRPLVVPLARLCPYADRVVAIPHHESNSAVPDDPSSDGPYDIVFVPRAATDHFDGLAFAATLEAGQYWGFSGTEHTGCGESVLTHAVPIPPAQSHARQNLALLWAFSDQPLSDHLENWPTQGCVEHWRDYVRDLGGGSERPLCLLGIGATHQWKIWRPENFAAIIPEIQQRYSLIPILVASFEEAELAEAILSLHPKGVLYHRGSTLEDICALSTFARLYVGNDTAPKHIAAAAGVPVVEINPFQPDDQIYRQERSANFHPHGVPHFLLHPPHDLPADAVHTGAAVNAIAPKDVAAAIQTLMLSIGHHD